MTTDKARKTTDKELEKIEKRLSAEYNRASKEIQATAEKYFKTFQRLDEQKKQLVADGKLSAEEYKAWRKNKILYGKRYEHLQEQISAEIANVNRTALDYINGKLPPIYAINYNATGEAIENQVDGYSFELVNQDTVKILATNPDTSLLPKPSQKTLEKLQKSLDEGKDIRWNKQKINSEILQGVLQGDSMPKIAKRMRNVTDMNKSAAIRNARTMVTGAENGGRLDGMKQAEKDGLILKKEWLSASDSRTRDWHDELDGAQVDIDEPFENSVGKIMFPGDPSAHPSNVYNCRCAMASVVVGFRR